jgi:hypothetical protein
VRKILICQPYLCGLTDILCQIGHCIKYCQDYDRKLIIDTKRWSGMRSNFSDYFILISDTDKEFIHLSPSDEEIMSLAKQNKELLIEDLKIEIDFSKNHNEDVLVHRSWGNGLQHVVYALSFFKLQPELIESIKHKLNLMPSDYCSVYVRNTDYKTDYKGLFDQIKSEIGDRYLLICTDDYVVIEYAKNIFPKLIFNEDIIKNPVPVLSLMNRMQTHLDKDKVNINAITDLILGASSMKLYPSFITSYESCCSSEGNVQFPENTKSGFVTLGIHLNQNKNLIDNLLLLTQ